MDSTDKLERLAGLLREGMLTREEFDRQKAALLGHGRLDPQDGAPPRALGAYQFVGQIGEGGMGVVYRGRHRRETIAQTQGGDVAIKVLHAHYARNERIKGLFEREADLGVKLDHPGIVKVHELLVDAGRLALVMEFVEGRSLDAIIAQEVGPIPWPRARPMVQQLLDAVGYAHGQGVIHRDLKPENIIVTPAGTLKVLDFGIAKDLGGSGHTATGVGMGTVDYMAPEQHTDAKSVDERADVYALGLTLYEMLAGGLPWDEGLDPIGVLHRKMQGSIPPPSSRFPHIPGHIDAAVAAAIEPARDDRLASVAELAAVLGIGIESEAVVPRGVRSPASTPSERTTGLGDRATTPRTPEETRTALAADGVAHSELWLSALHISLFGLSPLVGVQYGFFAALVCYASSVGLVAFEFLLERSWVLRRSSLPYLGTEDRLHPILWVAFLTIAWPIGLPSYVATRRRIIDAARWTRLDDAGS